MPRILGWLCTLCGVFILFGVFNLLAQAVVYYAVWARGTLSFRGALLFVESEGPYWLAWSFHPTDSTLRRSVPFLLAVWLAIPLAFLPLTDSLRLARVNAAHVARVWLYSSITLLLPLWLGWFGRSLEDWYRLGLLVFSSDFRGNQLNPRLARTLQSGWPIPPLICLWLIVYWWCAIRNYLRLERPVAVFSASMAITLLLSLLALKVIIGRPFSDGVVEFFWYFVPWWGGG